jgi:hypothetical protein
MGIEGNDFRLCPLIKNEEEKRLQSEPMGY